MNKKEIELHYLPYNICCTDVLGFHHSTKSTEASSSRSDTKVVAGMRRGGSWHGTGWAAPPVVASSAGSRCSSRNGTLGWCRPLGGVGARCSHGAVKVQVLHTLSEEVGVGLLSMLLPLAKAPKHPWKPSHSRQDEMMCHRRFRVLSTCRRPVLDPLCLHRGVHVDHNQDQLIQLIVQPK